MVGATIWENFSNLIEGALILIYFGTSEFKETGVLVGSTVGEKFSNLTGALGLKFFGTWEFKEIVLFFGAKAGSKGTNKGSENFLERGFSTEVNNLMNFEEFLKDLIGFFILLDSQKLINFEISIKTLGDFSSWKK